MASIQQLTGMRGVYLVAAELSRLGFIASPTSRSAIGADILATANLAKIHFQFKLKQMLVHSTSGFSQKKQKSKYRKIIFTY